MFAARKLSLLPAASLLLAALLLTSCQQPAEQGESIPWLEADAWESAYLGESKVGYSQTADRSLVENGRTLIETHSLSQMTLSRNGQSVTQQLDLTSVQTLQGELVRFSVSMKVGPQPLASEGVVEGDQLIIKTTSQGKTQTSTIPWKAGVGGLFADRLSLRRDPLQPGEERSVQSLAPIFNQIATVKLVAGKRESTPLLAESRELLRVESTMTLGPGQQIESTLWVDEAGRIYKQREKSLGQLSYRTTEAVAKADDGTPPLELINFSVAKVSARLANPHATQEVVYRVHLDNKDPAKVFAAGVSQSIKPIDAHTAEITVRAVRPNQPEKLQQPLAKPVEEDLAANNLIQSDDRRIVAMAGKAAPDAEDPWQISLALEKLVGQSIRKKNFSQAFATAAEVAEHLEGDCTEHAVLLAALCRARGIPARVAIGLVYYAPQGGYAYHMWDEVWIQDRWVPLDATLARGGIGGAHLKLADSNLAGSSAYSTFLPVYHALGQLKLEILSSR